MSHPRRRVQELQTAVMLLTRLPVGSVRPPHPSIAEAGWAFPVAGALVGAIAWAGFAGACALGLPPTAAAWIAIGTGLLATGGLHEDGLADFADGFGGGRDKAAVLRIMRDSRIGSYGVLALIATLGAKSASLAALGDAAGLAAFVSLGAASRAAPLILADRLRPSRDDGLGQTMGERAGLWRLGVGVGAAALALSLLGMAGLAAAAAMTVATAAVGWIAWRKIGGQTGDVLGAAQTLAETAGWLAVLAVWH